MLVVLSISQKTMSTTTNKPQTTAYEIRITQPQTRKKSAQSASNFQSKTQVVAHKNPFFQIFFISFHTNIYEFILSEKYTNFQSNAQVRPTKGNVFLVRRSLGEGGFQPP